MLKGIAGKKVQGMLGSNKIALIKDHNEALGIWRRNGFKDLTLVHLDAHVDFAFHPARPLAQAIQEAQSVKDLKNSLETMLVFKHFTKDFDRQTNIGNYIYPAMREGIVRDFYWIIPGGADEFKSSRRHLRVLIKGLARQDVYRRTEGRKDGRTEELKNGINTFLMGRRFIITTLEGLPVLPEQTLLDIDTDFLVIDSLSNAAATAKIGKRRPWISPQEFAVILRQKIKNPAFTTIAYSVNGGFTPMKYRHLGDEIAYCLAPAHFNGRWLRSLRAVNCFNLFCATGKKAYYRQAINLNPVYRTKDNNYGPLYLNLRKFSRAEQEFTRIAKVDPGNPDALIGLGSIYLHRAAAQKAKACFRRALLKKKRQALALLGLAEAEFSLGNLPLAKRFLQRYIRRRPLHSRGHHLLGDIYRSQRAFEQAVIKYKDALSLADPQGINILLKLRKIIRHIKDKDSIMAYIAGKYRDFKKQLAMAKRVNSRNSGKLKNFRKAVEKILRLEKLINE